MDRDSRPSRQHRWGGNRKHKTSTSCRFDPNLKLPGVAMRHKFLRSPEISIGVRCQLYQLAVVVSVSFGNLDRPRGFDYHEPVVLSIKMDPVRRSSRDDDEVSLVEGEDSEYRF